MVLQKRLDYGFKGYHSPPVPRAARSAGRRCIFKSKVVDQQVCAFDLLASVAGKLLSDGETSPSSLDMPSVVEDPIFKDEKEEENSCYGRKFIVTELVAPSTKFWSNDLPFVQNGTSELTNSTGSYKIGSDEQLVNDDCKLRIGIISPLKDEDRKSVKIDCDNRNNLSISNNTGDMCSSGHVEVWKGKPSSGIANCVVNSVKFPICGDHFARGLFQENVKLINRDNDENSFDCNGNGIRNKGIRKPIASKHYKVDDNRYNVERSNYLDRKESLKRERSIRDYPFKKRKLYSLSSVCNLDEGISSDEICNVHENGSNGGVLRPGPVHQGVSPNPSSVRGENTSFHSLNHKVKLKIKSFRVPELFVEISETATVGSLKKTVMETVNAVLGGGLRVGVILQGKKMRDDNKTLLQTGISHDNKMDALGFVLEPSPVQSPIRLCPEDRAVQLSHNSPQPFSRYPPTLSITWNGVQQGSVEAAPNYSETNFNGFVESDHDYAASRHDMSLQKSTSESKALVPVTNMKPDALAVVPFRKSTRSESAQRRIRRPFAVAEVEALVQAVEKLGTGRWRDVKLRAFNNAKHRTYVDLKDKWKTLVHTARISPQQRRGEPVPQELLDRVLAAHAYWAQHHLKAQPDTSRRL